jgi:hypothetical protein
MTPEDLMDTLALARAKRAELTADYKAKYAKIGEVEEKLEAALLAHIRSLGPNMTGLNGKRYRCFMSTTRRYNIKDRALLNKWVLDQQRPDMFEARIAGRAATEYLEANKTLPPGMDMFASISINVQKVRSRDEPDNPESEG